ncbi:MAG: class I SAM-dependent methyltransferase [Betaproteobacteria bacterium]|nr:class I SAM-dependent methyltransferase [Betaproteobacteria bacterium]
MAGLAAGLGALPLRTALAIKGGRPSRTARGAALQRAAHQLLETPLVFDDPLALRILGAQDASWLGANLEQYRGASARAMRAFLVMRSRYAEDELARAVAGGVRQYVVLGAGLDTFACRNPHPLLRVFEVDDPATQHWKRDLLKEQSIEVPSSATFAPVDFETQTLAAGLKAAGFRADSPAFFSWLGVVIYLSQGAVAETLRYVAARPQGSQVVFDFAPPSDSLGKSERARRAAAAARVAKAGEPWINYYNPGQLVDELRATGFSTARSLAAGDMNERYFSARADGFRLYGSGRMMNAEV